jgi:hypothetical protein
MWIVLPWSAVVLALLLFARKRQKTLEYSEEQAFKAELPWWVGTIERLVAIAWEYVLAVSTWRIYSLILGHSPAAVSSTTADKVFVVLGIGLIIIPLALLCANAVSWIVPPLRHTNEQAFRSKNVSFRSLNIGLMKGALVSVGAGILFLSVAAFQPWSG